MGSPAVPWRCLSFDLPLFGKGVWFRSKGSSHGRAATSNTWALKSARTHEPIPSVARHSPCDSGAPRTLLPHLERLLPLLSQQQCIILVGGQSSPPRHSGEGSSRVGIASPVIRKTRRVACAMGLCSGPDANVAPTQRAGSTISSHIAGSCDLQPHSGAMM